MRMNQLDQIMQSNHRSGFTLIELVVVIAIIGFLSSVALALFQQTRLDARDKRRIEDLYALKVALNLYHNDHVAFPKQEDGMNGDISTNQAFMNAVRPYVSGIPFDPVGIGNTTYYYYYDGAHQCGNKMVAIVFARQMDRPEENSNYGATLATECSGLLDGEGRGGGTGSYNVIVGPSNG